MNSAAYAPAAFPSMSMSKNTRDVTVESVLAAGCTHDAEHQGGQYRGACHAECNAAVLDLGQSFLRSRRKWRSRTCAELDDFAV